MSKFIGFINQGIKHFFIIDGEYTLVMAATNSRMACQILSLIVSSWLSRVACLKSSPMVS